MKQIKREKYNKELFEFLEIDCSKCYGLCCVALYFSKSDGFPRDKSAGSPCMNLNEDFTCKVHKDLIKKGLKGCTSYDCFGAGQKICQGIYKNKEWTKNPKLSDEIFSVFVIMRQLHEMLWYLCDGLTFTKDEETKQNLINLIKETYEITNLTEEYLLKFNIGKHRDKVNTILKVVGQEIQAVVIKNKSNKKNFVPNFDFVGKDLTKTNLVGANLAGSLLIASNMKNSDLSGAIIIGADMRDADVSGANLKNTLYLTQSQINTAKGNKDTILPEKLNSPSHWNKERES